MPAAADVLTGLTTAEARARLARDGFNELPSSGRRSGAQIAGEVMREPMFALLIAAAAIYALLGDRAEAMVLLGFATISVSIAIVQQGRSERALDALRELTSPRALVVRDGARVRIPGREVVRGDVVVIAEGDRVPADGVLVAGDHVEVDEALLTGESQAMRKRVADGIPDSLSPPGGENASQVFSGTLVIRGTGLALILATGSASAIGAIGQSLSGLETEQPRLQRETRRLVIAFGAGGLAMSVLAFLLYWQLRGSWLEALLGAIALGMSLLPEEFPLVLTVFMVMGAWRLSRSRVLTRRAAAIESLGAATVLCTDKTGTLTRNLMSVAHLQTTDATWEPDSTPQHIVRSASLSKLLAAATLASDAQRLDPMDRSIAMLSDVVAPSAAGGTLLREYPLHAELLAVTRVWDFGADGDIRVAAKGAPEAIAGLCGMAAPELATLRGRVDELARRGMRVLAVAGASASGVEMPAAPSAFDFRFLGLVGFADPLRESVPDAIGECKSAGIRVLMITGDYPATASAIARQAGIDHGEVCSGDAMRKLDDVALASVVREVSVFARISPDQKLRIVNALKANGEIVAMTGDGVNDAPALKAAHIGIAMGGRGTDVAREAASIVLLDDDFGSIVRAVRLGRRIYDNLRKAMGYILAIHVPIAGIALLPVLFGWPLVLTPMLIALLELIIDPACSVVLEAEAEESDVMRRPPRRPDDRLLTRALIAWSVLQGVAALVFVAAVFFIAMLLPASEEKVRTLTFVTLVGANIALIFVNRTFSSSLRAALGRPNRVLGWGLAISAGVLATILSWPALRGFFSLAELRADELAMCFAAAAALLLLLEIAKTAWRRSLAA
ncbi:MAG TPA: cation-translocating P-type ATPase [Steroidobacteraceae bacterium]|nr:cation-translocating P-type ATPase [Steroidobacteraceae bacterium]